MSQINRSELPGLEALSRSGKKDGQTIMVNNENEIEVYSWSEVDTRWIKIGVAVGSATAAGGSSSNRDKASFEGKDYDFVFDISLDDEGTSLKLPYNLSEDPWFVAQQFIHKHELDQIFLDQIAQFIITNTKSQTITSTSSSYSDPFTGSGRYTPGNSGYNSTTGATEGSFVDPFTGGGRYTPHDSAMEITTSSAGDPFTGENAYVSSNQKKKISKANEFYPQGVFVLFEQANIQPVLNKIKELQTKYNSSSHLVDAILEIGNSRKNDLSDEFQAIKTLLADWPEGKSIDAILKFQVIWIFYREFISTNRFASDNIFKR